MKSWLWRFKDGGEAFPDLSGDGEITQEDILIGKGVIKKAKGGIMERAKFASGDLSTKEIIEMKKTLELDSVPEINKSCEKCMYINAGKNFI